MFEASSSLCVIETIESVYTIGTNMFESMATVTEKRNPQTDEQENMTSACQNRFVLILLEEWVEFPNNPKEALASPFSFFLCLYAFI